MRFFFRNTSTLWTKWLKNFGFNERQMKFGRISLQFFLLDRFGFSRGVGNGSSIFTFFRRLFRLFLWITAEKFEFEIGLTGLRASTSSFVVKFRGDRIFRPLILFIYSTFCDENMNKFYIFLGFAEGTKRVWATMSMDFQCEVLQPSSC